MSLIEDIGLGGNLGSGFAVGIAGVILAPMILHVQRLEKIVDFALGGADMEPIRIPASEVLKQTTSGKALLVCAYPDEATCSKMKLPKAISRTQLQAITPELKKDQEIIFYCI